MAVVMHNRTRALRVLGWTVSAAVVVMACSPSGVDPAPPAGTTTKVVGATGGTVATSDGAATIEIPAGALPDDVAITITPLANPPADAIGTAYEIGPSGTRFSKPVSIVLRHPPSTGAIDEVLATTENGQSVDLKGGVNPQVGTVFGLTTHLTPFWRRAATGARCASSGCSTCLAECCTGTSGTVGIETASGVCQCVARDETATAACFRGCIERGETAPQKTDCSTPPADAGVDAPGDGSTDPCAGRVPAPTGGGTQVSNASGVWTPPPFVSFDLATAVSGYAERNSSGAYKIQLADYANACGHVRSGLAKLGGKSFQIFLYQGGIQPMTYTSGFYVGTILHATGTPGACGGTGADGLPPDSGSVTVTAADTTHIAGSFSVVRGGVTYAATFDVPVCAPTPGLSPSMCCVP
jgi:hypothetical protein